MGRQLPRVAVEPDALPELRAATREAHEAAQELRQAKRDLEATWEQVRGDVYQQIRREVISQLAEMGREVAKHRDRSVRLIHASMNRMYAALIGADPSVVDDSSESTAELANLLRERVIGRMESLETAVANLIRELHPERAQVWEREG